MSMGLEGAFGAEAVSTRLRERILEQERLKQQAFQNALALRGADRADRSLTQQDELTRLRIQELADAREAAATDKQFTIGKSLNETLPAETVIPTGSAAVTPLRMIGALRTEQPTLPSTSSIGVMQAPTATTGDLKGTGTGTISGRLVSRTANAGNPLQYRKMASAGQQNVAADNARADSAARATQSNQPLEEVIENGRPVLKPRGQSVGMTPYHVPPVPQTVTIQTVDAQGNPVARIVPKVAGSEFVSPPTGAQRSQASENTAALSGITRIKELTATPGVLDEWVGPVQGRVNSLKLVTPGLTIDPTMAEFFAEAAAIKNRMIRAITGAQMSEPEAKRIMAQLPDINQKPEVFLANLAATERNLSALNTALAAKPQTAPRTVAPAGDPYEDYLRRRKQ